MCFETLFLTSSLAQTEMDKRGIGLASVRELKPLELAWGSLLYLALFSINTLRRCLYILFGSHSL